MPYVPAQGPGLPEVPLPTLSPRLDRGLPLHRAIVDDRDRVTSVVSSMAHSSPPPQLEEHRCSSSSVSSCIRTAARGGVRSGVGERAPTLGGEDLFVGAEGQPGVGDRGLAPQRLGLDSARSCASISAAAS